MVIVDNLSKNYIDGNKRYVYSYRIIKDKVSFYGDDDLVLQSYGIEIERQDIVNGNLVKIERDMVKCISPHKHKVYNLLNMLYRNTVSPIHLIDVLGEYIDEYITDFDDALKDIYIC